MIKSVTVFCVFITYINVIAQNIVPNSDFEIYSSCPWTISQINLATPWNTPTLLGSPDYFNACAGGGVSVPINGVGYQTDHSGGGAYGGFFAFQRFSTNFREYIQVELTDTIIKDIPYKVSFYVTLADDLGYAVSSIGMFFSHTAISRNDGQRFDTIPQVINPPGQPLTSKENWMLITDTFISNVGGEKYITIGNFNDDSVSDTVALNDSSSQWWNSYYYIDDVSVVAIDTTIGINEVENVKFEIYPNPAKEKLMVELAEGRVQITAIKFFDVTGREVLTYLMTTQKESIDVSGFAAGVYTAVLMEGGEVVGRRKIIIE